MRGVAYRFNKIPRSLGICGDDIGSNYSACRVIDTFPVNFEGKQGQCEDAETFDEFCERQNGQPAANGE